MCRPHRAAFRPRRYLAFQDEDHDQRQRGHAPPECSVTCCRSTRPAVRPPALRAPAVATEISELFHIAVGQACWPRAIKAQYSCPLLRNRNRGLHPYPRVDLERRAERWQLHRSCDAEKLRHSELALACCFGPGARLVLEADRL